VLVFIPASSMQEAEKIAQTVVEERLAACANIISNITSVYRWEGEVRRDQEVFLIAKTRRGTFSRLTKRVKEIHSYEVPEVIAVPVEAGLTGYLNWIAEEVSVEGAESLHRAQSGAALANRSISNTWCP